jgi:hypothetical protein
LAEASLGKQMRGFSHQILNFSSLKNPKPARLIFWAAESVMMQKFFYPLACAALLLAACGQVAPEAEVPAFDSELEAKGNPNSPVGTNLEDVSPFTNNYPFIDAFKTAREWTTYDGSPQLNLDANGWIKSFGPNRGVFTQVFNSADGRYPTGDYILLYDGKGNLSSDPSDDGNFVGTPSVSGNTTRQIVRVTRTSDKGIAFGYSQTDPSNYIRNVRLIMPGGTCAKNVFRYAASNRDCPAATSGSYLPFEEAYKTRTFHPTYLSKLRNYSTLRFMTWQRTNGSVQTLWSGRPKTTDATWATQKGVPLEVMIELANILNVDPWFNMPHAGDNTYVTEFAKLTRARLERGRKVYLEYSNEVWLDRPNLPGDPNPADAQYDYAVAQGKRLGLVSSSDCLSLGTLRCNALNGNRFQVRRSLEVFGIWQQNFGSSNLVRVISGTTLKLPNGVSNPVSPTRELLRYQNAYTKIDALAIAPYFGDLIYDETIASEIRPLNVTQYFSRLNGALFEQNRQEIREQKATIASFSNRIPLIAYEGGQILVQEAVFDPQLERLFDAVNRDPRMKQVYLKYLEMWKAEGGQLYNHFYHSGNWGEDGRWGTLEYLTQPRSQAPKYDAIQTFIETTPKWW